MLSQNPQVPGTWYHYLLIAFFIQAPDCQVRGQVRPNFHPVQPQTNLQQVQTPKVIWRSMAPEPRAQKANTHPTQYQDTTTTIKQGRPVDGAMRFHQQEWQELTDNPWIIQCTQDPRTDRDPTRELLCALSLENTRAELVLEREVQDLLAKDAIDPTTKSSFSGPMIVVPQERRGWHPECVPLSLSLQDGEYQQCEGCYPGE